jgi:hypothetical protein
MTPRFDPNAYDASIAAAERGRTVKAIASTYRSPCPTVC